jgi:hypothetical protein
MDSLLFRIKKIVSFSLIVGIFQMIITPAFIVQTYAASVAFTDDISSSSVQSDMITIDITAGTAIISAEYGYSLDSICDNTDTYGNSFDTVNTTDATVTFTVNTESHNGEWICASVDDGGLSYYPSSHPLNIDITAPTVNLVGSGTENIFSGATYVDAGATWDD